MKINQDYKQNEINILSKNEIEYLKDKPQLKSK